MTQPVGITASTGGRKQKRADAERAVTGRFVFHISSQVSVAPGILARTGIVVALNCVQQLKATKYKRSTSNERLYRNAKTCYVTQIRRDGLQTVPPSPRPQHTC